MVYKTKEQPLCRFCGRAIKKWTRTVWFGATEETPNHLKAKPISLADAQRHVNEKIVRVDWSVNLQNSWQPRYVRSVGTWDGESYADPHFCGSGHAILFARAVLRNHDLALPAHNEALRTRLTKRIR